MNTQTMRERFTNEFIARFSDDEDTFFERVMAFIESERQLVREKMRRQAIWECERELAYCSASGNDDGAFYVSRCIDRIGKSNVDLPEPVQTSLLNTMNELKQFLRERIGEIREEIKSPTHPTLQSSVDLMAGQIIALQDTLSQIEEIENK